MEKCDLTDKIIELKEKRDAVILAHNYQIAEVQDIADHVGDSLELSQLAAESKADVIVFCGVHFMAESAAMLAPDKIVLLPEAAAGCPLADMISVDELLSLKKENPNAAVATYINSSAAVKAESDICITSANAIKVVNSLNADEVIITPDGNLASYISKSTDKKIIAWPGYCITHHRVTLDDIKLARENHPGAVIIVHPECRPEVVANADKVLGTGGMIRYAQETDHEDIIIGTEEGMIHRLRKECPGKRFFLLSSSLVCPNMKYTNRQKVASALENMEHRITVKPEVRERAVDSLRKMLAVTSVKGV